VAQAKRRDEETTPHNLEAERAVLGSVLIDNAILPQAAAVLQPQHFFRDAHRRLFHVMLTLASRHEAIDLVTLRATLGPRELAAVGGAVYIASLLDGVPRSANIAHYARLVKVFAQARTIVEYARLAITTFSLQPADLGNGSGSQFLEAVRRAVEDAHVDSTPAATLFHTAAAIAEAPSSQAQFIVPGYLAAGCLTELAAKMKTGKTTLLGYWVKCITENLDCLGWPVMPTAIVWLTEERMPTFREALERVGLLTSERVTVLSYWDVVGRPWPQVVDLAKAEATRTAARLLIVDTLPQFSGLKADEENQPGHALEAMAPIQRAAAEGLAVAYTRHERKSGGDVGDSARGSSAFGGTADIVLALQRPEGRQKPTIRILRALSRFNETPATLVIEKVSAQLVNGVWAESFVALGDENAVAYETARTALETGLPTEAAAARTIDDLQAAYPTITRPTLQRVLKDIAERIGPGKRGKPFRYFRPEKVSAQTSYLYGQKESDGVCEDDDADGER
jgi:hypothetical protein